MLDQNQKDVLGLGLVAAAVFFAFVFYLGWDGGEVGEAFADGFVWLFGGVGYLVPIALFARRGGPGGGPDGAQRQAVQGGRAVSARRR